jgi:hypothetical protein
MVKPKPRCSYLQDRDQVPVQGVNDLWIMSQPTFALGAADARAARQYHVDYDLWDTNGQWNYERGRMWAVVAPRDMPLKARWQNQPARGVPLSRRHHLKQPKTGAENETR